MARQSSNQIRLRIHKRIRQRVSGTTERPRLAVFRSLNHIYAQIIDDGPGSTLAAASTMEKDLRGKGGNIEGAKLIGQKVAERAKLKGITRVVFDRGGYLYHGRVKALADAARAAGLEFLRSMAFIPPAKRISSQNLNLKEQVVSINRVTKVVKGGKNMSFSALVVVGDPGAKVVGYGTGKAKEVPSAIKKGIEAAKKNLRKVNVLETTIRHTVLGRFGSGLVLLKPAPAGTGVIAGGPVRAVIQAVGIPNVLTKSIGSHNAHNVVKATIAALEQLCDKAAIAEMRGLPPEKL